MGKGKEGLCVCVCVCVCVCMCVCVCVYVSIYAFFFVFFCVYLFCYAVETNLRFIYYIPEISRYSHKVKDYALCDII